MVLSGNIVSCAIVGDGMVGKTSLMRRFADDKFSDEYTATMTETVTGPVAAYGDKYIVNMQEHDDESTVSKAVQHADVIVLCYSAADRTSFVNIKTRWIPAIGKVNKKKPIVLVATQSDIRNDSNEDHVSDAEGQNLMKLLNADYYNKCSAATSDGVQHVFQSVVCAAIKNKKKKSNVLKRVFAR